MRFLKFLLGLIVVCAIAIFAMRLAFPLPDRPDGPASAAIPVSEETELGRAMLAATETHPDRSGVVELFDGRDALAARVLLIRAAEESIDAQYYIWQADTTGFILLDELRQAAERGVRVRLLLDDNGIPGLDGILAAMNEMENVEVRIFNPFTLRSPKLASYLFDFPRLNRRMHNKAMTFDGAAAVIGGRNIGDIYFAYGEGVAYFDLDVLGVGPIVDDVSANFDDYWTSGSVYPAEVVLPESEDGLSELVAVAEEARQNALGSGYREAVASAPLVAQFVAGNAVLEWTDVTLVSDDPSKGLGRVDRDLLMMGRLNDILGEPQERVDLVSAYLIPGESGTELLTNLEARGVETRLLTNSLEATDVAPVHSAWINYRRDLLEAGSEIFELRARPELDQSTSLAQLLTGSASSLHAKTFAIDNERIFIGSFNFDPRSASINTEMGFLIESPSMAERLSSALGTSRSTYEVMLDESGDMIWVEETEAGEEVIHEEEPNTSGFQRGMVRFMSWLPFEWML